MLVVCPFNYARTYSTSVVNIGQQFADLEDSVKGLVSAGELKPGPDGVLLEALDKATAEWNAGDDRAANLWLHYFIARVRAVIAKRAVYTPLIDAAKNIMAAIGG